ncbi:MAG: hypothetical protein MMC33_004459 [Icmadophila ericetorum]|nr:hypothetical protein [Icmadophila ericetorum]
MATTNAAITVGVLALQGAFIEHIKLLQEASTALSRTSHDRNWSSIEVRTPNELAKCDALIIPGGESTTISLVAARSGLLEELRAFVKVLRKPTWGTCAGLILLAESANRTKRGGQDLIGGLDVRVNRNHFGRQTESFEADILLPFLDGDGNKTSKPFNGIFIRAPVVEKLLPVKSGEQETEAAKEDTVIAPSRAPLNEMVMTSVNQPVEIMATLPGRGARLVGKLEPVNSDVGVGDIIAVRQGNVFGTSFHPELTRDARVHIWWLEQVRAAVEMRSKVGS